MAEFYERAFQPSIAELTDGDGKPKCARRQDQARDCRDIARNAEQDGQAERDHDVNQIERIGDPGKKRCCLCKPQSGHILPIDH